MYYWLAAVMNTRTGVPAGTRVTMTVPPVCTGAGWNPVARC